MQNIQIEVRIANVTRFFETFQLYTQIMEMEIRTATC